MYDVNKELFFVILILLGAMPPDPIIELAIPALDAYQYPKLKRWQP